MDVSYWIALRTLVIRDEDIFVLSEIQRSLKLTPTFDYCYRL